MYILGEISCSLRGPTPPQLALRPRPPPPPPPSPWFHLKYHIEYGSLLVEKFNDSNPIT